MKGDNNVHRYIKGVLLKDEIQISHQIRRSFLKGSSSVKIKMEVIRFILKKRRFMCHMIMKYLKDNLIQYNCLLIMK